MSIITNIIGAVTGLKWKIAAGVSALGLIAATGALVVSRVQQQTLTKLNAALTTEIYDPKTGYVVKLNQADSNTALCRSTVVQVNTAVEAQSAKDAAVIAQVQARYDTEHAARAVAERQVGAFLAHKPTGATLQDQYQDVDRQVLGDIR